MSVATAQAPVDSAVTPAASRRKPAMSSDDMQSRWPSLKTLAAPPSRACEDAWIAAFTLNPEAMVALLQDIIKQAYAQPGRIGQRPMPREEDVNLEALLRGEFSEEPMHVVLPKLMRVSERVFCARVFLSRTQFQRLLAGEYHPTVEEIRHIAAAVKKPASFFVEYRLMAAQAAFLQLITENPGLATKLYRTYVETRAQRPRTR